MPTRSLTNSLTNLHAGGVTGVWVGGFSPLSLFTGGEAGAILLANDFSFLYQDAAMTQPVTAFGQPCGAVRDRSGRGYHATQATAAQRPTVIGDVVSLGPELVANGDFASSSGWTAGAGWSIASGVATASASSGALAKSVSLTAGKVYQLTITVTSYTSGSVTPFLTGGTSNQTLPATSVGTLTKLIRAEAGNATLSIQAASATLSVDNVSLREVTAWSGQPRLHFNGATQWLTTGYTPGAAWGAGICVVKENESSSLVFEAYSAAANGYFNNNTLSVLSSPVGQGNVAQSLPYGDPVVWTASVTGDNVGTVPLSIMARNDGAARSFFTEGELYGLVIISRALTDSERAKLARYLQPRDTFSAPSVYVAGDTATKAFTAVLPMGDSSMVRVSLAPTGKNGLFNFSKVETAPLGNPQSASWTTQSTFTTDWIPPMQVAAQASGDAGGVIFTGGNHGSDGSTGGSTTASMTQWACEVDGAPASGVVTVGCQRATFRWTNRVLGYNTITLSREIVEQVVSMHITGDGIEVVQTLRALEAVTFKRMYGPQMVVDGFASTVHFFDGAAQVRENWATAVDSGTKAVAPDVWAISMGGAVGQQISWIDRGYGVGDLRHVSSASPGAIKGGNKAYHSVCYGPDVPIASGKTLTWRGGYSWSDGSVASGAVDSAFSFRKRRQAWLGWAMASGSGAINVAASYSGGAVGSGTYANALDVTAAAYSADSYIVAR